MSLFGQEAGQTLRNIFHRRDRAADSVRPGSTFQRVHPDNLVETAKVLSVDENPYGIPHVKFLVSFQRSNRKTIDEGNRILALETFADRYRDRVTA